MQGARELKVKIPEAVTVFILASFAPGSGAKASRAERRSRRCDCAADQGSGEEIRRYEDYHYVVISRKLAEAEATLSAIVRA